MNNVNVLNIHKETHRIAYFDALRLICIFGVVMLHVSDDGIAASIGSQEWHSALVYVSLSHWILPIFIMISGALFLNPAKKVTMKGLYGKYVLRLLLAYIYWLFVYAVIGYVMSKMNGGGIFFKPHFHLWFLPLLISIYMLIPLIKVIAKDLTLSKYALILWCTYLLGRSIFQIEVPQISPLFETNTILGYGGYFLLGYYLSQIDIKTKVRAVIYGLGLFALIVPHCYVFHNSFTKGETDLSLFNNLNLNVVIICITVFVLVKELFNKIISVRINWLLEYTRKELFGIYLVHAIWLIVINRSPMREVCSQWISVPIITVVIFVLSLYTTKLLCMIPLVRKVVE